MQCLADQLLWLYGEYTFRSSYPELFYKKGVLKNFAKFIRKNMFRSLLFNKVAGWRPQTLLKGGFQQRCCHMNFAKLPKTPILWNTFERLLLYSQTNNNLEHVCLCPFIWFVLIYLIWLALKYKSKRNTFDSFTNSKKNYFWFLIIHYSLGFPSCFLSDCNTSAFADNFYDIYLTAILFCT